MNNINLVPNQYKKAFNRKWFVALGIVGVVGCLILLAFLAFIPVNKIREEKNREIILDKALSSQQIERVKNVINQVNAKENEKEKMLLTLKTINSPSLITKKSLDIIVESAPKGLRMGRLEMKNLDSKTYITGKARNATNISQYIILLHNTNQFQQISYTIEQKDKPELEGWIDYHIEIQDHMLVEKNKDLEAEQGIEDEQEPEEIESEDIL